MISAYLLDIIILLVAAVVAVPLSRAARLGAVPGFLIAGVIVGPSVLGLISNINEIGNLAEIGAIHSVCYRDRTKTITPLENEAISIWSWHPSSDTHRYLDRRRELYFL